MIYKFILDILRPFKKWILAQGILSLIWAIDFSLRPYLVKVIIDTVHGNPSKLMINRLVLSAFFYVVMSLLIVVVFRFYDFVWLTLESPLKRSIGETLMERMMAHSQALFQENLSGTLTNKIKDVMEGIPDLLKIMMNQFFSHFLGLFIAVYTLCQVSAQFGVALILWVSSFLMISFFLSKKAQRLSDACAQSQSVTVGAITDMIQNMSTIRLFNTCSFELKGLKHSFDGFVQACQKKQWYFLKMFACQGISFVLYQGACLTWLIEGFQGGKVSPGDFALVLTLNISMVGCLWQIAGDLGAFSDFLGSVEQGLKMVFSPIGIQNKPYAKPLHISQGEIIFDKVTFGYQEGERFFHNQSVVINPREKIGLVGYSGSGKSTFVNLILRLFEVCEGRILIDGQNIQEITLDSLRKAISIVPQDPTLFHRTLRENIGYGDLQAQDEEVIAAAQKAHAHDFIVKLPEHYNTVVGEKGMKISGGERQRIAIARAILKKSPILILDEATSRLDSVTEKKIQESLKELMQGKTTIVIAHRLSTLVRMDRIFVFDEGKIVQQGPHEDLLKKPGLYQTLWKTQVGGFLPEKKSPSTS